MTTWRARFGLAELCGTVAAFAGFGLGLARGWPLAAAAGLATGCEAVAFYAPVAVRAGLAAWRATGHLSGWRRAAGAGWHAASREFASAAAAELADDLLIRPWAMTAGAWIGGHHSAAFLWLGFAAGKFTADAGWYAAEASARRVPGAALPRRRGRHAAPRQADWDMRLAVSCWAGAAMLLGSALWLAWRLPPPPP